MTVHDLIRARRQVVECDGGWQVSDSDFVTVDKALAVSVAAELDRVDPLDRAVSRTEAVDRARQILDEMERLLDTKRPDQERFDALRRELDLLEAHVRSGIDVDRVLMAERRWQ